jgi:hypothetical protein
MTDQGDSSLQVKLRVILGLTVLGWALIAGVIWLVLALL